MDPPAALIEFLAAYPHPAFILPARVLHDALIERRETGHITSQDAESSAGSGSQAAHSLSDGVARSVLSSTNVRPLGAVSKPALPGVTPSVASSGSSLSSHPSAAAILSTAFATHPADHDAPEDPSSFLTGGRQPSHDPTRTAEGAVRSMMEHRAAAVVRRNEEEKDQASERVRRDKDGAGKGRTWSEKDKDDKAAQSRKPSFAAAGSVSGGQALKELLRPIWSNPAWDDLMRTTDGSSDIGLVALLSRSSLHAFLAILVDTVEPLSSGGLRQGVQSKMDSTGAMTRATEVSLTFPVRSVYHSSGLGDAGGKAMGSAEDPNAYNIAPPLNMASLTESKRGATTLDFVATLYFKADLVVITSIFKSKTIHDAMAQAVAAVPASPTSSSIPHAPSPPEVPTLPLTSTAGSLSASVPSFDPSSTALPDLVPLPTSSSLQSESSTASTSPLFTPHSTDRIPAPLPEYRPVPLFLPTDSDDLDLRDVPSAQLPHGFVAESSSKRKRGGSRKAVTDAGSHTVKTALGRATGQDGSGLEEIGEASMSGNEREATREEEQLERQEADARRHGVEQSAPNGSERDLARPSATESSPHPTSSVSAPSIASPTTAIVPADAGSFLDSLAATPMGRSIAAYPWHTTPLGPIARWGPELKVMVSLILASPFRSALWWGSESVLVYNDEYAHVAGDKHPQLLGKTGAEGWSELWDQLGPLAARVMQGETVSHFDHHMAMYRHGFLEETYHIWSFIPLRDADGKVLGYQNPSFETTARVIAERRLATIRDLTLMTSISRSLKEFCQHALTSLSGNPYDLPFVLLYTAEVLPTPIGGRATATTSDHGQNSRAGTGSFGGSRTVGSNTALVRDAPNTTTASRGESLKSIAHVRLSLQGTVGVPEGHSSAPEELQIKVDISASHISSHESDGSSNTSATATNSASTADSPTMWPFVEAFQKKKPVFMSQLGDRTKGYTQRGWPDVPINAVCIPVMVEEDQISLPRAVLILGLNPRRPWNEVYATFLNLLARQMATGLFSVLGVERDVRRAEELEALDRAKTNFFSNVSHELRTPLSLILGPLEDILSAKDLAKGHREQLSVVQRHGNRLLGIVNSLLDFSRLEGGQNHMVFRPTSLSAVTADLASLFRSAIERGGIQYVVDCQPDPTSGRPFFLARDAWEKILFNLIGNAFKYTLAGKITVTVRIDSKQGTVQVADTGCGIEDKELGLIFDRFHRVESTSRSREGTGIGLALTLELVKVLGGTLEVESQIGQGSTFSVTLPRGSSHLPQGSISREPENDDDFKVPARSQYSMSIVDEAASWQSNTVRDLPMLSASSEGESNQAAEENFLVSADLLNLKNSVVLLADDNVDLRSYIASILSKVFNVVQCQDGQAALEYCQRKAPDLIVSDIMMPRLDGRGLLAALRGNPSTAHIPVIFLSAQAGPEARVEALLQGAADYLSKPFQSRELLARVNVHLQLGKLRKELERRVEERTRALIESEIKYRGLADRYSTLSLVSPVGVFLITARGELTYANPRWFDITGHPADKPLRFWQDSVLPEDLPKVKSDWARILNTGSLSSVPQVQLLELRWSTGVYTQLEIRPIRESGMKSGWVGALTDLTHQKEVEALRVQLVEQRATEQEEQRKNMEMFIDMSSHELRNPLSGVWQNAEVIGGSLDRFVELIEDLQSGEIPDEATLEDLHKEMLENTEAVESIMLCASHQGRIADDILNVSKINMGLLSVTLKPFDLADKMSEVVRMFDVECQQKQIELTLARGPSLKSLSAEWIVADPIRLAQILINFLTNSVKYTSVATKRAITIHIDAYETPLPVPAHSMRVESKTMGKTLPDDSVWIVVAVQDTGKGLSPDEMKKLFARFSQANPRSDQYEGSGLGLYVSRKLVELHHGYIEVESVPSQGSIFRFAIPAARAQKPAMGSSNAGPAGALLAVRALKRHRPSSSSGPSKPFESKEHSPEGPLHILVVEDNLINQKVMSRQLKLQKFEVSVANHGQEALDIISKEKDRRAGWPISLILMDIEMPVMNGLDAIKELRRRELSGDVPKRYNVIAVTGNARQGQIDECLAAGFNDVALKPYKMAELLLQIAKLEPRAVVV